MKKVFLFFLLEVIILWLIPTMSTAQNALTISSDFPGGNIIVEKMSEDTVWLKPDSELSEGSWFYWYFRADNINGRMITFCFTQENVFTTFGPSYSINNNGSWNWYGENRIKDNSFTFNFSEKDSVAWFSMAIPYTASDLYSFLSGLKNGDQLKVSTLCNSPEGREVEKINIWPTSGKIKHKVMITARHHACEMIASYVMEGIIESILNEKELGILRDEVEFLIIPFVDKDGVENGEQGKNRIPRDHNRDYVGESVHRSTATLRNDIPEWADDKLKIFLDVHCPWIKGEHNEWIYMVGSADKENEKNQNIFSKLLERNTLGELKYYHQNFLPFGVAWNTGQNYNQGLSSSGWAVGIKGISMASTIEVPYANVSGVQVSKDKAREFGKAVAYAIQEYLELEE